MPEPKDKLFSRTEYRRVIAWPERIRREAPFLESILGRPPGRVLDAGCGTGEHVRHLAEAGWTAVGIDVSEDMIGQATDHAGPAPGSGSARFELRDAADAAGLPEAPFDAALCIGNAFAFVESRDEVARFLAGVAASLRPGAPFLLQMLNYERIEGVPVRALPVNVRPLPEGEGDGEIVFIRVLRPRGDGSVDFYPIALTLTPGAEELVTVRSAKEGRHFAWKRPDLERALVDAGFADVRAFGTMADIPYEPLDSPDLVLAARRAAAEA